ncbi:hypothetical protein ACKWCC_07460, partial [Maribacter sp. 2307ULW6-5]
SNRIDLFSGSLSSATLCSLSSAAGGSLSSAAGGILCPFFAPKYPSKQFPITARKLAGHLSGMPHYSSKDSIQNHFYNSVTESLGVFFTS